MTSDYEKFIKPVPKDFWNHGLNPITGLQPSKVTGQSNQTVYDYKQADKRITPKIVKV